MKHKTEKTVMLWHNSEIFHDKGLNLYSDFCSLYHTDDFLQAHYPNARRYFALLFQLVMTQRLRSWKKKKILAS